MRWLLVAVLMLSLANASAQIYVTPRYLSASVSSSASPNDSLPDAPDPSASANTDHPPNTAQPHLASVVALAEASFKSSGNRVPTCDAIRSMRLISFEPDQVTRLPKPCAELVNPYQQFLSTKVLIPLTWEQKGYLGLHNVSDLANIATIVGISAITVAADSHSAYGPGLTGFAKSAGVSLSQDVTGQFFGTFAIPTLVHQDPRYFRMPQASVQRRIFYSISRTFVSRNDDGTTMPNYATLATYPIASELGNLYVPGIQSDGVATVKRIAVGLATDPANNLLNEFLPDVAKRIHIRIIFVQRILNNVAGGTGSATAQ
jgi:hypothetical protein